jgi:RNA polymerase sigma-70 factor (ECF subfamily)
MRMNETEKELVEMVLAGRTEAFDPLVSPYRHSLLALTSRLTGNVEDGKEIAQEALFRAFRFLSRFDTSRSFRNWLYQIAVNAARDRTRKKRRESVLIEEAKSITPESPDPGRDCAAREVRSGLMKCLTSLTSRERDVFILRDIEDLNIKETAAALGCSSVSVRVHLSSARRKMREAIRERFPHLEETS